MGIKAPDPPKGPYDKEETLAGPPVVGPSARRSKEDAEQPATEQRFVGMGVSDNLGYLILGSFKGIYKG